MSEQSYEQSIAFSSVALADDECGVADLRGRTKELKDTLVAQLFKNNSQRRFEGRLYDPFSESWLEAGLAQNDGQVVLCLWSEDQMMLYRFDGRKRNQYRVFDREADDRFQLIKEIEINLEDLDRLVRLLSSAPLTELMEIE
ncbi:MAG TPA: hypothetical protein VGA08_02745 [Candidatus Saccharimonadales bacterium]